MIYNPPCIGNDWNLSDLWWLNRLLPRRAGNFADRADLQLEEHRACPAGKSVQRRACNGYVMLNLSRLQNVFVRMCPSELPCQLHPKSVLRHTKPHQ